MKTVRISDEAYKQLVSIVAIDNINESKHESLTTKINEIIAKRFDEGYIHLVERVRK